MNSTPWVELTLAVPLLGAALILPIRDRALAYRLSLGITVFVLVLSLIASFGPPVEPWPPLVELFGRPLFDADQVNGPLIPLMALFHVLTVMTTARTKSHRFSFAGALGGETVRLGTVACVDKGALVVLLTIATVAPFFELLRRGKPTRVYCIHMSLFATLLIGGWSATEAGSTTLGPLALMLAILLRCGVVPAHLWIADLFENASFGAALLFAVPLVGIYAAVRLVLPVAPNWMLDAIGFLSLFTALYAAGMALVQTEARRFFAYLFLSNSSLVLLGLELHTALSLAGSLYLWLSVSLALTGLGLTLRALEARYGRLSLKGYRGLYDQSPTLACCYLITGLATVGFPGTIGFIAAELLMDGAVAADLALGIGLILAAAINGIGVVRVYFLLFTGTRHESAAPLGVTNAERIAILTIIGLIFLGGIFPQPAVADRYKAAEQIKMERNKP